MDIERLKEFLDALKPYSMRNAFEFRNKNWINKKVFHLLEKYNAAVCMADHPDYLADVPVTADFLHPETREGRNHRRPKHRLVKEDAKFIKTHASRRRTYISISITMPRLRAEERGRNHRPSDKRSAKYFCFQAKEPYDLGSATSSED
jgi:hypothetical protein